MSGWDKGFEAMFGNSDAAYAKGYKEAASLEKIMLDARKKRDAEIGRANFKDNAQKAGVPPQLIDLMDGMFNADKNPQQVFDTMLKQQEYSRGEQLWSENMGGPAPQRPSYSQADDEAAAYAKSVTESEMVQALAPDLNRMNRGLAVMGGKPVNLSDVKDGLVLNPMTTPDQQDLDMTTLQGQMRMAVGESVIGRNNKTGDAALIRANKPPAARAGSSGKPATKAQVEAAELANARAAVAAGADPAMVAKRLRDRSFPKLAKDIYQAPASAKAAAADGWN